MKFISFDIEKCDNCYKCLRSCPTKAIIIRENEHSISDDLCIKCGICQETCPQNALSIKSEFSKVQEALQSNKKVIVSLAPSFATCFKFDNPLKIVSSLKALGFHAVEETAIGAELVSKEFEKTLVYSNQDNLITSCCPSANYLIEQYYPECVKNIIPCVSPMLAHGKKIKMEYGYDSYVVFIGPCLAKKAEAEELEHSSVIDAVLTFEELEKWFENEGIVINEMIPEKFSSPSTIRGASYPSGSGLWNSDLKTKMDTNYKITKVSGIDNCIEMLEAIKNGSVKNYCIEMTICTGSCLSGPGMTNTIPNVIERKILLHKYVDSKSPLDVIKPMDKKLDLSKNYIKKPTNRKIATEAELWLILNKIGKYSEADLLNCSACGYRTCMEKAQAVYENMSDIHMCLPYLRSKAESISSTIFAHSPNSIVIVDSNLKIQECNPSFKNIFVNDNIFVKNLPISAFMDDSKFVDIFETHNDIKGQKVRYDDIGKIMYESLIYLSEENVVINIMMDITENELKEHELLNVKEQTLKSCQEVINKQMRVAQEIASLLGETTAETKVNLNRLKEIVIGEDGNI